MVTICNVCQTYYQYPVGGPPAAPPPRFRACSYGKILESIEVLGEIILEDVRPSIVLVQTMEQLYRGVERPKADDNLQQSQPDELIVKSLMANQLPDELIAEILSRLPAKSVCRFRCVSKTWRNVIGSTNFPKSQFSHNPFTQISVFKTVGTDPDPSQLELEFTAFDLTNCSNQYLLSRKVNLCPLFEFIGLRIVGTCDGFICFSSLYSDEIVVVNALTSEKDYRILHDRNSRWLGGCDVGFGYDPSSDGYKVVLMKMMPDGEIELDIYAFKSKTWKLMHFPWNYIDYCVSSDVYYSNGALHWLIQEDDYLVQIAVFDLVHDDLKVVKYDVIETFGYVRSASFNLAILGGCLCLCCRLDDDDDLLQVEIWVMKGYGVGKESWSKLGKISIDANGDPDGDVVPLAISKCGRRLLVHFMDDSGHRSGSLHWYDMDDRSLESVHNMSCSFGFYVCLQSLIKLR